MDEFSRKLEEIFRCSILPGGRLVSVYGVFIPTQGRLPA